jgi:hypothetical protein
MIAVVKGSKKKSKSKSLTDKKSPGCGTEALVRGLFHSEKACTGADFESARI